MNAVIKMVPAHIIKDAISARGYLQKNIECRGNIYTTQNHSYLRSKKFKGRLRAKLLCYENTFHY